MPMSHSAIVQLPPPLCLCPTLPLSSYPLHYAYVPVCHYPVIPSIMPMSHSAIVQLPPPLCLCPTLPLPSYPLHYAYVPVCHYPVTPSIMLMSHSAIVQLPPPLCLCPTLPHYAPVKGSTSERVGCLLMYCIACML